MRTSLHALTATDALRRVWFLVRNNIHLAGSATHSALGTFLSVHAISVYADAVKQSIKHTQRTDISAEGAEYHHRKDNHRQQDYHFPRKQKTHRATKHRISYK